MIAGAEAPATILDDEESTRALYASLLLSIMHDASLRSKLKSVVIRKAFATLGGKQLVRKQ